MLDEADYERDGAAPIDMLETYYAAHGWEFERHDDEIVVSVKGSWTEYELRALWREEDSVLQFLAFPDIKVPEDRRVAIYETIGLVNEQLWLGHFELWSSSGILLYRHAAMIDGEEEGTMTLSGAEVVVDSAIDECERFYPVFQFVLWAASPRRTRSRRRWWRRMGKRETTNGHAVLTHPCVSSSCRACRDGVSREPPRW